MVTNSRPQVEHPPGHVRGRLFSDVEHPIVLRTEFDVPGYLAQARGRIAVDSERIEISEDEARDLGFLWRLENSALAETRALLASWTANEARITAFVTGWGYERYWLARALRDILEASPTPSADSATPTDSRRGPVSRLRGIWVERGLPILAPVIGGVVKEPLTAGHMARLAIQEATLQAAERAVRARLGGEAARVLTEIIDRREEIIAFFRSEAVARIRRSRIEAVTARAHLIRPWAPLRIVGVAEPDEARALTSIFASAADRRGLIDSDAEIGQLLPGNPQPSMNQVTAALRSTRRAHARAGRNHGI
ncbi:hypothetical protein ACH82I_08210 [Brevibacterium sp. GP-SGM9]|uniref:hypothetical protein n=1 Tax=Brevibacterium sp. GP-SGM9 TaxID=3376990 RepID=UPI0039A6A103